MQKRRRRRREDISRYVVIQRRKGKNIRLRQEEMLTLHSHFVQESKEEREWKREKYITNETDIAGT